MRHISNGNKKTKSSVFHFFNENRVVKITSAFPVDGDERQVSLINSPRMLLG